MERRALIAIALSVAVLLAWQVWIGGTPPPTDRSHPPEAPGKTAPHPSTGSEASATRPATVPRADLVAASVAEVITPLYRVSFAADGSVTEWTIEHRGDKPLVVGGPLRPLAVAVQRPGQATEVVALHPDTARTEVGPSQPVATLGFSGTTTTGLRGRRTLEFRADSYRVRATLRV